MQEIFTAIQNALVEATSKDRQVCDVDGCRLMLTPDDSLSYLNYAVPTADSAASSPTAIIEAFHARDRIPRFEFNEDLWPGVSERLLAAGFHVEARMPIMIVTRQEWEPRLLPTGVSVKACTIEDSRELSAITTAAFADSDVPILEETRPHNQASISSGRWLAVLGYADQELAGGGVGVGDDHIREAAGIGVIPKWRRKGVGGAITSAIVQLHFDRGGHTVWLTPGDERAHAVYARLGFREVGNQVCLVFSESEK